MVADNGKSEHDIVESRHHISVGPGVKAAIYFISYAVCFAAGWYAKGEVTKGSIAESEIEVRKDDAKVSVALDKDLYVDERNVEHRVSETPYNTDCSTMSIADMRDRLRESEVDQ